MPWILDFNWAPRMIQSMEILQLPNRALWARIQREIRENPVLVVLEPTVNSPPPETEDEAPDAVVEQTPGGYDVRVMDAWIRGVQIDTRYAELSDDEAVRKDLLRRQVQKAEWLIEALERRRHTLEKVIRAILRHQRSFLDKGPAFREPCTMQRIAEEAGVHVITVGLAVEEKRLQTAHGIFPLWCFFASPGDSNDRAEPQRDT
jgi:RNA polymerase sigma-54 factor